MDEKSMSYPNFNNVESVFFYATANRQVEELATCPLDRLQIKGSITDTNILKKIFLSVNKIEPFMTKYDPGMGVINFKDGKEVRFFTYSLESSFYIIAPSDQKAAFKVSEGRKVFFEFQKRTLA